MACACRRLIACSESTSRPEASDHIQKLWKQLRAVKYKKDVKGPCTVFALDDDIEWISAGSVSSNLVARNCHAALYRQAHDLRISQKVGVAVVGTAGIGKSWWLNFVLLTLAALGGVDVVYQLAKKGVTYIFSRGGNVWVANGAVTEGTVPELNQRTNWFLYDPEESSGEPASVAAFTVIAASPNCKHYQAFAKRDDTAFRFMPPWTLEELKVAKDFMSDGMEEDELQSRFEVLGGVPRTVFADVDKYRVAVADQGRAIDELDYERMRSLLLYTPQGMEREDDKNKVPHKLFHCFVDDEDFKDGRVRFINDQLRLRFMLRMEERQRENLWDTVMLVCGGSSIGSVTEEGVHAVLPAGWTLKLYRMDKTTRKKTGSPVTEVYVPKLVTVRADSDKVEFAHVKEALASKKNRYVVPLQKNRRAIDAYVVMGSSGHVYLVQVTVGKEHEYDEEEINRIVTAIGTKAKQVTFFFFVPQSRLCSFKYVKTSTTTRPIFIAPFPESPK